MSSEKISVREASRIFNQTYTQFYDRTLIKRFNYPKIHYTKKGTPFLYKDECLRIAQEQNDFFKEHISITQVSKKCFNSYYTLTRYLKKKHDFFTIVKFNDRLYIRKSEFDKFYHDVCGCQRLIPLHDFIKLVGLTTGKFYAFADAIGLFDKVAFKLKYNNTNKYKLFFKLSDINEICSLYGLKKIPTI